MQHALKLEINCKTQRYANAMINTLSPDPILKPDEASINYEVVGETLVINIEGQSIRSLRVTANGLLDTVQEALECISSLDS